VAVFQLHEQERVVEMICISARGQGLCLALAAQGAEAWTWRVEVWYVAVTFFALDFWSFVLLSLILAVDTFVS
jgi:hypothetical protein